MPVIYVKESLKPVIFKMSGARLSGGVSRKGFYPEKDFDEAGAR